jgi:tetratricopeptide (TPR) repeat protein
MRNPEQNMVFNKTTIVLCILCCRLVLVAQDKTGPLIERMQRTQGTGQIDIINELSAEYRKTDRFKALKYARQAYKLSVGCDYKAGLALARKNEGICWFFIGNNDSAEICYNEALEVYTQTGDKKGMSACFNNLGLIAQETGSYDDAIKQYERSMDMDQKLGDEIGMALTMGNIADIYMYQGKAKKALILTNKCIETYTRRDYKPGLLSSFASRASEFDYLMRYDESLRDFNMALKIAREIDDRYQEVSLTGNIGVVFWHKGAPDTALSYLNKSLSMSDENDDGYNIDNTLETIAQIFASQKQFARSNGILFDLLKRSEKTGNKRKSAVIMTSIARNLIELNEIDKATGYLTKSLEIATGLKAPYEMLESYRNLSYANAILHNFKAADSLQDLFARTYCSLVKSDSVEDIKNRNPIPGERIIPKASNVSNWILTLLLFALILMLSVFAYGKKGKE